MQKSVVTNKNKTIDLAYMGMALALMIVSAKINIPIQPIPIAMQTFAVMLIAMLLGARRAVPVLAVYLLIGLIGLPVFTAGGGPDYVLKPSFGYLIGFIAAAFVTGTVFDKLNGLASLTRSVLGTWAAALLSSVAGLLVIYAFGVTYLSLLSRFYFGSQENLLYFLRVGAWIFIPSDLLSSALAGFATVTLFKLIPHLRRTRVSDVKIC